MTDQNTIETIKYNLDQGITKDQIYKDLLIQGLTLKDIDDAFSQAAVTKDSRKKTVNVIVIFGAILIGAGIFSFIASNWQGILPAGKVGIILVSIIFFYVLGWYLSEYYKYPKTAEALYLLGTITYGAGIYLVAQIYNIRANWPDGMLLWLLGSVVMAYALESYVLYFFAVPLGIVAIFGYPSLLFDFYGEDSLIFTSTFLLIITFVITFLVGIHMRNKMPEDLKQS
jgi:uncharacterized membrane protein